MRVLGVDPGLTRCGLGVVDSDRPGQATLVAVGVIRTPPSDDEQIVTTTNSSLTHAPQFGYADQSQSRLMNIPRELRDMIYGFVTGRDAQLILGT